MEHLRRCSLLVIALPLAGCDVSGTGEVQQWIAETRATVRPSVQPVPEPKQFTPQPYDGRGTIDPFDPQKVAMAVSRQQQMRASASAIKPDLDRRRETLEAFPLDQIRMVGMMKRGGANAALLEAAGTTHLVRIGNYVGQNFGLVTQITESEVQVKEIVQDAAGEWIERPAKLELQEARAPQEGRKR